MDLNFQFVFALDHIMNRWKQIIEEVVRYKFGQFKFVIPGRYKFITLPVVKGLPATVEEMMGKWEEQYK